MESLPTDAGMCAHHGKEALCTQNGSFSLDYPWTWKKRKEKARPYLLVKMGLSLS